MTGIGNAAAEPSVWWSLAERLQAFGVQHSFGLPGDDMVALVALEQSGIGVHLAADQRHAVYSAVAYARLSGTVGISFVGKGPAVTHAASGVLEAQAMRTPLLLLTSGVPPHRLGSRAFQELDAIEVLKPLTKWARRVCTPETALSLLDEALWQATTGTPGAVCLEIPEGMASTPAGAGAPSRRVGRTSAVLDPVPGAASLLDAARRPVLLVGGGSRGPGVGALVTALADRMGAAILCTASGRGVVDESSPWFLGLSGLYAAEPAVEILKAADLVVALGSQLEETTTYGWPEPPPPMLQVNVTASELSPRFRGQSLLADVSAALRSWSGRDCSRRGDEAGVSSWREEVRSARRDIMAGPLLPTASGPTEPPRVREVLAAVDSVVPAPRVSLHENGLQDMWSYFFPAWQVRGGSDCLVPSEQTPLGFAFAAAPGAVLAAQGRPVVVIGGDGAFSAALSDLATLAEVRCPLLLVVLANGGFGWLEVNLRNRAEKGPAADVSFLRSRRPHAAVSAAYGIPHVRCGERRELPEAVQAAWSRCRSGGPVVLEVEVSLTDVPPGMEQLAGDFPGAASLVEVG